MKPRGHCKATLALKIVPVIGVTAFKNKGVQTSSTRWWIICFATRHSAVEGTDIDDPNKTVIRRGQTPSRSRPLCQIMTDPYAGNWRFSGGTGAAEIGRLGVHVAKRRK